MTSRLLIFGPRAARTAKSFGWRGKFLYWVMYTPAVIEPALGEKVNGIEPNPTRSGWGSFDLTLRTLEAELNGKTWLINDQFTAADVLVGSSVAFMSMFGMLPESESLKGYVDRCLERPACQKTLAMERN